MKSIIISILFLFPNLIFAQLYTGKPCSVFSHPELRSVINDNTSLSITLSSKRFGGFENWATSMLRPEGPPPPIVIYNREIDNSWQVSESAFKHDFWSCSYSAYSAQDGDTKTSWCEGIDGDGIGEGMFYMLNNHSPLSPTIRIGVGASPELYQLNNRPKRIRVSIFRTSSSETGQAFAVYHLGSPLSSRIVDLLDIDDFQPLTLPALPVSHNTVDVSPTVYFLYIEILDIYHGIKFTDTCISEIRS